LALGALAAYSRAALRRLWNFQTLYNESVIVRNFRDNNGGRLLQLGVSHRVIRCKGTTVAPLQEHTGSPVAPPATFQWKGAHFNTEHFMRETWKTGLLVLKVDGVQSARVLFERYRLGNDVNSRCMSWSVGKSILSTLFGVACSEGLIGDINVKTVTDYLPQLQGTAYEGVRLKDIKFGEEYSSPFSDINRMGYSLAFGWSIESFIKSLKKRDHEPGTYNNYVSMDSQVLGLVLAQVVRARGYTLSSYLEEKIWSKAGFQANATWWLDNDKDQMELAIGTLGITTRDYARFGWLFLNGGLSPATGDRLIAEEWVRASTTAGRAPPPAGAQRKRRKGLPVLWLRLPMVASSWRRCPFRSLRGSWRLHGICTCSR